jgi:lipase maturation factor 1
MASFSLVRVFLLKYLGFLYFVAYLISWTQNAMLIGDDGLTPATIYMNKIKENLNNRGALSTYEKFNEFPTLFWFIEPSTSAIEWLSFIGITLSLYILIDGSANMIMLSFLWVSYLSLVNIGQVWYGFGWESQLLETGFLAIILVPMFTVERLPSFKCPWLVIMGYRWLIFRIMLGAGLIKIRGDSCWRDYTCMNFHYQTQPVPNPLSPYYHARPGL